MKRLIIIILIFTSCISNKKSSEGRVEFYLTRKRLESSAGVRLADFYSDGEIKRLDSTRIFNMEIVKIDTTGRGSLVVAGPFKAEESDLQAIPIVSDEDIISFNLKNNSFSLSKEAKQRIKELNVDRIHGKQFVITVDGTPKLTGYFCTISLSSYANNHTNYILIEDFILRPDPALYEIELSIDYPEIYKALKLRGKLN